jgi:hypothetical protein
VRAFWRAVAVPAFPETEPVMVLLKVLVPLQVLVSARRVEEAAKIEMSVEPLNATPLIVREVWRVVAVFALPPIERVVVETKVLAPFTKARMVPGVWVPKRVEVAVLYSVPLFPATRPERVPKVGSVEKVFAPEKVLLSERSVVEAMVMFTVPLKETPLIVRAFWRAVAVPAFPETEPVMVLLKVLLPLQVLVSARRVEEAAPASEVRYPLVEPQ